MPGQISDYVATLTTAQLVAIWNAQSSKPIKKFTDRTTAENRVHTLLSSSNGHTPELLAKAGVPLPAYLQPKEAPEPELGNPRGIALIGAGTRPAFVPAPATAAPASSQKEPSSPHLNLRCPACGYYAKTTIAMMTRGRLLCPTVAHGKLLTAEERGEKRGVVGGKK